MTVRIGDYEFERVDYDARGDVLYLTVGDPPENDVTDATPEGHAVSWDATGKVVGLTIVNAKWLLERDGKITITLPTPIEAPAEELAPILS